MREYADYQRLQAAQLVRKQEQVQEKQRTLQESQRAKEEMLKQGENERKKLEAQEKERKDLLASLQKKQWTIQAEIKKKRQSAERLNAQIDRLIEIEIEQARKREEEARKREAAERKKAGQSRKEEGKPAQPAPKGRWTVSVGSGEPPSVGSLRTEQRKVAGADYRTLCAGGPLRAVSGAP